MIKFWRGRAVQRGIFALLGFVLAIGLSVIPAFSQTPPNPFRVATEATFPPFEFQQGGQLTGFDIDLMRAIGKEADLNIDFRNLPFDGIIPALQARTVEAAISGMTITAERAQAISFSRPYFRAGLAIAVREDNRTIKNFEDLKGKRIAVQIGTTGALEATKIPGATVSQFDSAALALQELINGRVEAVVNDKPVTLYAIKQAGLRGVKVVGELLTEEFYGIALPKNSPYLQLINDALGRVIESGQYDAIFRQWFGEKPPELPLVAPALKNFQESSFNWGELFYNLIFKGVPWTILLTVLSFLFGLIGGTLVAIALISPYKWLKIICRIYVDFFRGTPMLVQLFLIYFGLPGLFREIGLNIDLDRLPAALFALSLNVAAYLAEIMRGGIQSIDNGQWEACSSLGMSPMQTMREVIFPQAFRRMLPPLGNEFITLIKDTSLAAVIGFEELFRQGQLMVATTYKAFEIYIAVAVVYLVLTTLSSVVFKRLEIYMDPLHKSKQEQKA
ncbi:MAG: transporter substrate-binding domain-containing protein [Microcystis aeruginosa Ma_QC_Ch_20071001_S25]|uniref:Transporter substrate-binding domain-containing protein n=1 Tax=Microcystis aeruginosa Ma_QC_Ch_20071001_S25D TaxID=2486250 RepID=A0A552FT27_MICAE|nr:ABC transporter permease subunit [Microcystis sp. M113S1]MCA2939675.1 ABC transporter permease subunit [Microcystis sp. M113S1]TRU44979.1 MAG: transporter substrate-binding domain-containing protein [Microcystis aeruginosa Ma_QC_Ch_20071001_S25]TRU49870.1 MAG: transporter substrate-binding domain-containing protein [Microcystis aeruginosa Ma_QC_Ch_20071001_S25D]TRU61963.1 MAG: transporter substrate-binding domain-containing protein [Microcystis aeruginosa Ma_QC_Ch_20071001_M135]